MNLVHGTVTTESRRLWSFLCQIESVLVLGSDFGVMMLSLNAIPSLF